MLEELQSSYLIFEEIGESASGKTVSVAVKSRNGGSTLGEIHWYNPWRQYCFYPSMQTIFNSGCLDDIQLALRSMTLKHSRQLSARRLRGE